MKRKSSVSFDEAFSQYHQHVEARIQDGVFVKLADRVHSTLRRRFLSAFAHALGRHVDLPYQPVAAFWLDGEGRINNLQVEPYTRPYHGWRPQPFVPLLPRISLNCLMAHASASVRERLGVPEPVSIPLTHVAPVPLPPSEPRMPRLELTALPEELVAFGPWVASWYALQGSSEPLPTPPFPCTFPRCFKDPRDANYGWSEGALALHDACARPRRRAIAPDISGRPPVGTP